MTTLALSRGWSKAAAATHRIRYAVLRAVHALRRIRKIRADHRFLQTLPDHLLDDIGVRRGDIDHAILRGRSRG